MGNYFKKENKQDHPYKMPVLDYSNKTFEIQQSEYDPPINYIYRDFYDKSRDIKAHEVRREGDIFPYTILIYQHSKVGDKLFFSDLFYADSWDERRGEDGEMSRDIIFCIMLWRALGLKELTGEDFLPKHIEHSLDRSPQVYRKSIEEVFKKKFGISEYDIIEDYVDIKEVDESDKGLVSTF